MGPSNRGEQFRPRADKLESRRARPDVDFRAHVLGTCRPAHHAVHDVHVVASVRRRWASAYTAASASVYPTTAPRLAPDWSHHAARTHEY